MKQLIAASIVLILAVAASGGATPQTPPPAVTTATAQNCGLKPIKPIRPIGCDDLVAQCICDSQGKNCRWEWICVKK